MQRLLPGSRLKFLVIAAAVLCVAALIYIPTYEPQHPTGPVNAILNNLRKIDGAKELWMTQHAGLGDVDLTAQDLAPFLPQDFWKKSVAGERYIIGRPNVPPEAVLTRSVQDLPSGTRLRSGNDGKVEEIRPNPRTSLDAAITVCLYSKGHWRRASEPERSTTMRA